MKISKSAITNYLISWPIEIYVLTIFPAIASLIIIASNATALSLGPFLWFYFAFGGDFLFIVIDVLWYYFLFRVTYLHFLFIKTKMEIYRKSAISYAKNFLINQAYVALSLLPSTFFFGVFIERLSLKTDASKIIKVSSMLTDWDYRIFGRDALFWITDFINSIKFMNVDFVVAGAYSMLTLILPIFTLVLFLTNKLLAEKFILFFLIIGFISVPVWSFLPALAPLDMYINSTLKNDMPERISKEIDNYNPDAAASALQGNMFNYYQRTHTPVPLTAFPSMHAGWGFGIVIFSFILWPPLIMISLPWFILELMGAVYLGQHYVVDLLLGIVMATIAYFLVSFITTMKEKHFSRKSFLPAIDTIKGDFATIINFFKNKILKNTKVALDK